MPRLETDVFTGGTVEARPVYLGPGEVAVIDIALDLLLKLAEEQKPGLTLPYVVNAQRKIKEVLDR